jgi:transcriptional regulator with XRE-family HTH domain
MTEGLTCPDPSLQLLGATIRHYRKQRGISQHALATMIGFSRIYLGEVERGRRNISIKAILHIATALEVPLPTLLQPLAEHPELYPLPQTETFPKRV